ncbi:MAG: hypothetical protein AAF447_10080 [Myxococcota bacterium]
MARLTALQKADRVLRFLLSMKNPRITAPLVIHGFTAPDLDEGWALLRALAEVRLDRVPRDYSLPAALAELDEWENVWFPIARATLERHHPEAASFVFRNLHQTTGRQVILGVGRFIARVRALPAEATLGREGQAARDRLATRGLTDAHLDATEALVDGLTEFCPPNGSPADESAAEQSVAEHSAEDALWTWYLEWSAIARARITDRRLLRSMGFLRSRGPGQRLGPVEPEAAPGASRATNAPADAEAGSPATAGAPLGAASTVT